MCRTVALDLAIDLLISPVAELLMLAVLPEAPAWRGDGNQFTSARKEIQRPPDVRYPDRG